MIILHEVTKRDVLGKLPKDPTTQPVVEAFVDNIRFEEDKVHITIPPIPKGYRGNFVWNGPGGNGLIDVKPGQKLVYSIQGADGFGFGIFKGYIGVNTVLVELPTGAVIYGAETGRPNPTINISIASNGKKIETFGFKKDGKDYCPIRVIADFLKMNVGWDAKKGKALVGNQVLQTTIVKYGIGFAHSEELAKVLNLKIATDVNNKIIQMTK
jgi:hypothetical protein